MEQNFKWYFKLYDADGNGSIDQKGTTEHILGKWSRQVAFEGHCIVNSVFLSMDSVTDLCGQIFLRNTFEISFSVLLATECATINQHFLLGAAHSEVQKLSRVEDEKWSKHDVLNQLIFFFVSVQEVLREATKTLDGLYSNRQGLRMKVLHEWRMWTNLSWTGLKYF